MPHKRKFLSLVERVKVIEITNKSRSACKRAEDFGVRNTQVQNILKRKAEVLEEYENDISLALTDSIMGEKLKPLVIGKAQKPRCIAFNLCFIYKQVKL